MIKDLQGKAAVVTGAASGIGRAMSARFAAEGMNVVMADIMGDALRDAADAIVPAEGARVVAIETDVADAQAVADLAERAVQEFGKLHLVCANAGVVTHGTAWEHTLDDWTWTLGVNLWGVIHCLRNFVPGMLAHGEEGHVVITASAAGMFSPLSSAYPASKYAVLGIAEGMMKDLANTPIGVTAVCPGGVRTGIYHSERSRPANLPDAAPLGEETLQFIAEMSDPARTDQLSPEDLASLVVNAIVNGEHYVMPMQPSFKRLIGDRLKLIEEELARAPDILE